MLNDIDLTKEEIEELNELIEKLKHIEQLAEKSRKEKIMSKIVAVIIFLLTGAVMLCIGPGVIGYLLWVTLYGFLLYYIFGVRKSGVPDYDECSRAAKIMVNDCIKIIEHKEIVEIIYSDPEFYIGKYNKLLEYYPNMASKTLKRLICCKPKSKI
jgi:hypothetical protein